MTISTTIRRLVSRRLACAACLVLLAAALPATALAGGEPKNEWPFTRHVDVRTVQAADQVASATAGTHGEPKNELPFTRPAGVYAQIIAGEQKNQLPFTATVANTPSASGRSFDGVDAALLVVVVVSLAIAGAGLRLLTRHEAPRTA